MTYERILGIQEKMRIIKQKLRYINYTEPQKESRGLETGAPAFYMFNETYNLIKVTAGLALLLKCRI